MEDKLVKKIIRTKDGEVILMYEDDTLELLLQVDPKVRFIRPYGLKKNQRKTKKEIQEIYNRPTMIVPIEKLHDQIERMKKHTYGRHW